MTNDINKNKTLIIVAAVALVAVIFVALFLLLNVNPAKTLANAKESGRSDLEKVLNNAVFGSEPQFMEISPQSQIEMDIKVESASSTQGIPLFLANGTELKGIITTDEINKRLEGDLTLVKGGNDLVALNFSLDNDMLAIQAPDVYSKYISADLASLNADFDKSPLRSFATIPKYDYSALTGRIFTASQEINKIGKASANRYKSIKDCISGIKDIMLEYDDTIDKSVVKGEKEAVGDYKCLKYNTAYSEDLGNKLLAQLGGIDELTEKVDCTELTEPINATYYIDDRKKVRRLVYEGKGLFGEKEFKFNIDTCYLGESNIYDKLDIAGELVLDGKRIDFMLSSDGDISSEDVFRTLAKGKLTVNDKDSNTARPYELDLGVNYISATKDMELELEVNAPKTAGSSKDIQLIIGYKGKNAMNEDAKTMDMTFDELRLETMGIKAIVSGEFLLAPASFEPKAAKDLDSVKVLKLNQLQLLSLYTELNKNVQKLQHKIMEAYGF